LPRNKGLTKGKKVLPRNKGLARNGEGDGRLEM